MSDESISPLEAKRLREAFREVGDKAEVGVKIPRSSATNYVEIVGRLTGGPNDPVHIASKDGDKVLALAPVDNGTFKRLKREMGFFKRIHSGAGLSARHGNHS